MLLADSHNDFLIEGYYNNSLSISKYLQFLENNNVELINFALFTTQIKNFSIDLAKKIISKTKNINKNGISILYSFEDMSFFDLKHMEDLIKLTPFCCSLTWNDKNKYAGGANSNLNLTDLGKNLVIELEKNKIFIDTAHLNLKSFKDFVKITQRPILNTHCGFDFIKKHQRNITENQIKMILETDGFIGFALVNDFYNKKYTFNADYIAKCICQFIDKFGAKNIGLGSDFFGTLNLPHNIKNYNDVNNLITSLKHNGVSTNEIYGIFYKNFVDFIKKYYKS